MHGYTVAFWVGAAGVFAVGTLVRGLLFRRGVADLIGAATALVRYRCPRERSRRRVGCARTPPATGRR